MPCMSKQDRKNHKASILQKRGYMMERLFCVKNVMKKQCKNLGHQPVEVYFLHCIKSILKTAGYSTAIAARVLCYGRYWCYIKQ